MGKPEVPQKQQEQLNPLPCPKKSTGRHSSKDTPVSAQAPGHKGHLPSRLLSPSCSRWHRRAVRGAYAERKDTTAVYPPPIFFFLTVYFLLEEAGAIPILAASTADRLAEV